MKFSNKGKAKFLDNRYWFLEEFDQEDFDDVVILTVEEAKQIDAAMTYLYMNSDIGRRYADVINKLLCRIKQAEKGHETK